MISPHLARRFVHLAKRIDKLEPWLTISSLAPFAVELPDHTHPVYVKILGDVDRPGILFFHGELGFDELVQDHQSEDAEIVSHTMVLTFESPAHINADMLEVARAAGSLDRIVPVLIAGHGGREVAQPDKHEVLLAAQVLEALLLAHERDQLLPLAVRPGEHHLLTIAVSGKRGKVDDVTVRFEDVQILPADEDDASRDNEVWELTELLDDLPREDAHWLIGLYLPPMTRSMERTSNALIIADAQTAFVRALRPIAMDARPLVQRIMTAMFEGLGSPPDHDPGLASTITFVGDGIPIEILNLFVAAGVAVERAEQHPVVARIQDQIDKVGATLPQARLDTTVDETDRNRRHQIMISENAMLARLEEEVAKVDAYSRKALSTFFGDPDVLDELEIAGNTIVGEVYCEWFAMFYRPRPNLRTIAERILQGELPPDERELLEARIAARTGLYIIADRAGEQLTLRDALADFEVIVSDDRLPAEIPVHALLPGRVVTVHDATSLLPVGPIFSPSDTDTALTWLRQQIGHPLTSDGVQQHPEWLGRLWQWDHETQNQPRGPSKLVNTDGEELRITTATFAVASWPAFELALDQNPDIKRDDNGSGLTTWHWLSRTPGQSTVSGNTVLATFERVVDELLVHVNSTERLAATRKLLNDVPGVRFVRVLTQTPELTRPVLNAEYGADPDTDIPPGARARLQASIDRHCLSWIDERSAALDGLTPREAVASGPAGRIKVMELIETWPEAAGLGVTVPRAQMRKELGL